MQLGLKDFIASGFLTLKLDTRPQGQLRAYGACLRMHAHKYNWMAFFDVDEFLALRDRRAHTIAMSSIMARDPTTSKRQDSVFEKLIGVYACATQALGVSFRYS